MAVQSKLLQEWKSQKSSTPALRPRGSASPLPERSDEEYSSAPSGYPAAQRTGPTPTPPGGRTGNYPAFQPLDQTKTPRDPRGPQPSRGMDRLTQRQTREMSPEEFGTLSPRQQSAVKYNTDATKAIDQDFADGGRDSRKNLDAYLGSINLDKELGMAALATDEILGMIDNPQARQDMASTLRWAQGDKTAQGSARNLSASSQAASRISDALSQRFAEGQTNASGADTRPVLGIGDSEQDRIIKFSFNTLADANSGSTLQDVEQFLADANESEGYKLTMDDVFNFADLRLRASDFAKADGSGEFILALDPDIASKTADELRQTLGL